MNASASARQPLGVRRTYASLGREFAEQMKSRKAARAPMANRLATSSALRGKMKTVLALLLATAGLFGAACAASSLFDSHGPKAVKQDQASIQAAKDEAKRIVESFKAAPSERKSLCAKLDAKSQSFLAAAQPALAAGALDSALSFSPDPGTTLLKARLKGALSIVMVFKREQGSNGAWQIAEARPEMR